jgi:hypothetical protein
VPATVVVEATQLSGVQELERQYVAATVGSHRASVAVAESLPHLCLIAGCLCDCKYRGCVETSRQERETAVKLRVLSLTLGVGHQSTGARVRAQPEPLHLPTTNCEASTDWLIPYAYSTIELGHP